MFGYTIPIESSLSAEDRVTYRNYYCETCHHLREEYGLVSTMTVNYEMTFAMLFFNSILDEGMLIDGVRKSKICIMKHSASSEEFMKRLTAYTVLVAKNSLLDDVMDDEWSLKGKMGLLALNRAIMKAQKNYPEYDEMILKGYDVLREVEKSGESDPIVMGRYSSQSMMDVLNALLGERFDERMNELFRQLGIWVYVMDAIEDLDDDFTEGTYNPFLVDNTKFVNKMKYIKDNVFKIGELMGGIIADIQRAYVRLRPDLKCNVEILDNIIYQGIPYSAHRIIRGDKTMSLSLKNIFTQRMNRSVPPSMI